MCLGGGGGLFYCNTKTASLIKQLLFSWDISGNFSTNSTMAECVKRDSLSCIDEILSGFLEFPGVDNLTEANGGYKKFGFPKCILGLGK